MFALICRVQCLYNDITPTVTPYWEGPGWCQCLFAFVFAATASSSCDLSASLPPFPFFLSLLPAPPSFPPLPRFSFQPLLLSPTLSKPNIIALFIAVEMPSYTNALKEAYSCVGGDVACNAAPAIPSPADSWTGPNNP